MVDGKAASSAMVNGSMPRSSSSRATRIANASESNPVSCSDRSSWSGGSVTFCSSAICCIAEKILDLTDMEHLTSQEKRLFEPMLESDSGLHDARDGPGRSDDSHRSPGRAGTT